MLNNNTHNPDVLSCLANLSSDEVFTPPKLANDILDLLPPEIWSSVDSTFLDPACKSGVFMREVVKRLNIGLANKLSNRQERIDHILTNQVFGIGITQLTSLLARRSVYCSKKANGKYSVCDSFVNDQGNIRFDTMEHTWENEKCTYCNASELNYRRDVSLETHAYQFIHTDSPEEIFDMQFDVIVGNPPYQLSDGGFGASSRPIYQHFVKQAIRLNPRFVSMIIPARWFTAGKGLDQFRKDMLNDRHIRVIQDFTDAGICFPGVNIKGGVCYFLWDRDNAGNCKIQTHDGKVVAKPVSRPLLEKDCDTFIRYNESVSIIRKVRSFEESTLHTQVSARNPFGFATNFSDYRNKKFKGAVKIHIRNGFGYIKESKITTNSGMVKKHKVLISKAYGAGNSFPHQILNAPFYAAPGECCTDTYIVVGAYDSAVYADNLITYIQTQFFRFLVMTRKNTQDATKSVYFFVPKLSMKRKWTDQKLYQKYNLTDKQIAFIQSKIRPMEPNNEK